MSTTPRKARPKAARKNRAVVNSALAAVNESDERMNSYTPEQKRELESHARELAKGGATFESTQRIADEIRAQAQKACSVGRQYPTVNALIRGTMEPEAAEKMIDGMTDITMGQCIKLSQLLAALVEESTVEGGYTRPPSKLTVDSARQYLREIGWTK